MYKQLTVVINFDDEGHLRGVLLSEDPNFPLTFKKATISDLAWIGNTVNSYLCERMGGPISSDQSTVTNVT